MIKLLIKKIIRIFGWKLIKIRRKDPGDYFYSQPNMHWIKSFMDCAGVIHIGAHRGSEAQVYNWFNKKVIWIEANPYLFEDLNDNILNFHNQKAYLELFGDDEKKQDFYISNKDAACSSIFDFSDDVKNKKLWKEHNLKMMKKIKLNMTTFDKWSEKNKIDIDEYNHWVIDVQGSELQVLMGASKSLKKCKTIIIEISKIQYYQKGSTGWKELKDYLKKYNFFPESEPLEDHCDILFTRNF